MSWKIILVGTKPCSSVYPHRFSRSRIPISFKKGEKVYFLRELRIPPLDHNNDSYVGSHIRKTVSIPTYRDIIYKDFIKYPDTACPNRHGWSHFKVTEEIFPSGPARHYFETEVRLPPFLD